MESPDPKLDARLRAVPLPEGLIQRLRQVALADDDGLDAALTRVALARRACGARCAASPWPPTRTSTRRSATCPCRPDWCRGLRSIPWADDDGLDAALREVPVPAGLSAPWQRRQKRQKRLVRLIQVAAAASVLLAVAGLYFGPRLADLVATRKRRSRRRSHPVPATVDHRQMPPPAGEVDPLDRRRGSARTRRLLARPTCRRSALARRSRGCRGEIPPTSGGLSVPSNVDPLAEFDRLDAVTCEGMRPIARRPGCRSGWFPAAWSWLPGSYYPFLIKNRRHPFVSPPPTRACSPRWSRWAWTGQATN